MFEKWRIKEHMEIVDSSGAHVGTVDEVVDDRIKLTRSDSSDSAHHYLDWDSVDRIEDNRVFLKQGSPLPTGRETNRETVSANTNTRAGSAPADSSAANLGGSAPSPNLPGTESAPLFGTSGHGTGMGGSGVT